jgi:hypothetical protein
MPHGLCARKKNMFHPDIAPVESVETSKKEEDALTLLIVTRPSVKLNDAGEITLPLKFGANGPATVNEPVILHVEGHAKPPKKFANALPLYVYVTSAFAWGASTNSEIPTKANGTSTGQSRRKKIGAGPELFL